LVAAPLPAAEPAGDFFFRPGDRIVFLGDSITMPYALRIKGDERTVDLPAERMGGPFVARHPADAAPMTVRLIQLIEDGQPSRVQFGIGDGFYIEEREAGQWAVTTHKDNLGLASYHLEYTLTEKFSTKRHHAAVFGWDHDREELTGD
jgi:hypothetical protein